MLWVQWRSATVSCIVSLLMVGLLTPALRILTIISSVPAIEDNDEAKSIISGTATGLFFKSTSGLQKCARGGLVRLLTVNNYSNCFLIDWSWSKHIVGSRSEETRDDTTLHLKNSHYIGDRGRLHLPET